MNSNETIPRRQVSGAAATVLASALFASPLQAGWFGETFLDPTDNYFDMSQFMNGKTGFLSVPIVITEPGTAVPTR